MKSEEINQLFGSFLRLEFSWHDLTYFGPRYSIFWLFSGTMGLTLTLNFCDIGKHNIIVLQNVFKSPCIKASLNESWSHMKLNLIASRIIKWALADTIIFLYGKFQFQFNFNFLPHSVCLIWLPYEAEREFLDFEVKVILIQLYFLSQEKSSWFTL